MTQTSSVASAIACNAHAIERHGLSAAEIVDAYNQGAPCEVYESYRHNRRMIVLRVWRGLIGLVFTTRYSAFITAFHCSEHRLGHLIERDGYERVREAG